MKYRASLGDRNELAFKLRSQLLSLENPDRLAALNDPQFQPNHHAEGIYAFEFFTDKFRDKFKAAYEKFVTYTLGWSKGSVQRDEESKAAERIIRMSTALAMEALEEKGQIKLQSAEWCRILESQGYIIATEQLELFFYEVFYELAYELSRELYVKFK